jgi:hypothetical protein
MGPELQAHIAFHLTGMRFSGDLGPLDELELYPALFARHRDLAALRYDFPLVLFGAGADGPCVQSLSALFDGLLHEVAPRSNESARLKKLLLRLEREIRALVAEGESGSLTALWDRAAGRLGAGSDELLEDSLNRARAALKVDGAVIDCNGAMPARLIAHAWSAVRDAKARRFRENVNRLVLKLSDIVRADFVRSEAGRSAESLRAAVGPIHEEAFDFDAMSRLLGKASSAGALPESRRRRIDWALSVLRRQRFFPVANGPGGHAGNGEAYSFIFEHCAGALEAFRERRPEMTELAKAIAAAELEIEGQYIEATHDRFFDEFSRRGLAPEDLALFPDYLVCLRAGDMEAVEFAQLISVLSSGLPVKILVQTDDILEASPIGNGHPAFGVRSAQLARMAIGLNEVYVLQSSASNLFQMRESILKGLAYPGPALFSVFSGAGAASGDLQPYLTAAAAMEARAFPAFTWDPSAGPDWASRFHLEANPQVDADWPVHPFAYEDEEHQRVAEKRAFTFVDFAACDRRYAKHFARIPRAGWNAAMVPVDEYLARERQGVPEEVPYVPMVDRGNVLHRVIVDDKLIQEARRCREMWRSLQELGGIHNSHAERRLAREKKAWSEREQREVAARGQEPKPQAPAAAPVQPEPEQEKSSDEPYIETPRCTTCDECIQINNRMFAYDANKQAYIANLEAGSYRQLVEAAESCQVSIIHPGKPRNAKEPGLDDLMKRAEAFP